MSTRTSRAPRASAPQRPPRPPRVAYLVKWVERSLRLLLDEALEPSGVSTPEYTALSVLRQRDGLSSAQLARRVAVTPQAMNQIVIGLERRGLIRRENEAHGRMMGTSLTAKGAELLSVCDRATLPVEERLLSGLSRTEVAAFRRTLTACAASLGERAASGTPSQTERRAGKNGSGPRPVGSA
jgi:DNA-binding MarR family transcriptional regulator